MSQPVRRSGHLRAGFRAAAAPAHCGVVYPAGPTPVRREAARQHRAAPAPSTVEAKIVVTKKTLSAKSVVNPTYPPTQARWPRCALASPCRKASPSAAGRSATERPCCAEGTPRKAAPVPARRAGPLPRSFSPRLLHVHTSFTGLFLHSGPALFVRGGWALGPGPSLNSCRASSMALHFLSVVNERKNPSPPC